MSAADDECMDLGRLFNPGSVAFVGATEDQAKFGGRCVANILSFGYTGTLMPVNPRRTELFGVPCYASVLDLPQSPDHVGICLPPEAALHALQQAGERGVPFATVFTSGFLETGTAIGRQLHARMLEICARTGIRVMGPNCNGLASFVDRFALTSTAGVQGPREPHGEVAIVSQSGGAGQINTLWRARHEGLGISYQASTGNDADLDLLDIMRFMLEAEPTRVVLSVVERFASLAKLRAVAERAAQLDKPIVMVKAGRSEAGGRAAASHTGALSGADEVCDAILREYGVIRVQDTSDLVQYAKLLRRNVRPRGRRVAVVSVSGGNVVLGVDAASSAGLHMAELSQGTRDALQQALPGTNPAGNPIDLTAAAVGVDDAVLHTARTILPDDNVDLFVAVIPMGTRGAMEPLADFVLAAGKPVVTLWPGGSLDDGACSHEVMVRRGVPVYRDSTPCFGAIAASIGFAEFRERFLAARQRGIDGPPAGPGATHAASPAVLPAAMRGGGSLDPAQLQGVQTERVSKALLAAFGMPGVTELLARDADEAVTHAARFGRPVAMKIESPDIPHKTEAGAVRLGVAGPAAVRAAYEEIVANAHAYAPQARLNGVLLQEMAGDGLELFLGLLHDPVFGPVLTVGAGGIYVEVHRDVAYAPVPVSRDRARRMLEELRIWPILRGYRGQPPFDIEAALDAICALSMASQCLGERLREVDINPLLLRRTGQGACMVDALVVMATENARQTERVCDCTE